MLNDAFKIVNELKFYATTGRPGLDFERGLNGIFFVLKTGIQWNALPRCFGSDTAVHRLFQKLRDLKFFEKIWHLELKKYDEKFGLNLAIQAADCTYIKAPLGREKTGNSPVDRRKLGTKRSIIVDQQGIVIGCALGTANQHDSKLFEETLRAIPAFIKHPKYKEMHLDAAYDSTEVRIALFNKYYVPRIARNKRRNKTIERTVLPRNRWIVESSHSWTNRFRRLFVRFEKTASNYFALMQFAFSLLIFKKIGV